MAIAELDALNIDAPDAMALVRFYSALTGMPLVDVEETWPEIGEPGRVPILCQPVEEYQPPTWPTQQRGQQMHIDVTVADLDSAVAAVQELGGRLADEQPNDGWRVMLDPAGHPFCLIPGDNVGEGPGIGRWTSLTIDCADGGQLARFYEALFGMKHTDHGSGFHSLDHEGQPSFYFQPVEDYQPPAWPTQERGQQMHLDFYVDDLQEAVTAVEKLGARLAEAQFGDYYRVMLDSAGHPFCLAQRREPT